MPAPTTSAQTAAPVLTVNGTSRALGDVAGHVTLLQWLRRSGFTGSKEGCAEGECGACAVLVNRPDAGDGSRWTAINSCLVPAGSLNGQEVVTAEGLGGPDTLHPVQREMAERGGSQCGYCTPGFVCAMAAEYYRPDRIPEGSAADETAAAASASGNGAADAEGAVDVDGASGPDPAAPGAAADHEHGPNGFDLHALSGNLCRCTGYRPIRDAAYALDRPDPADPFAVRQRRAAPAPVAGRLGAPGASLVRPADLAEALAVLAADPAAKPIAGCTDWGVELNLRHARAGLSVAIDRLPELRELTITHEYTDIGAALTLSEIESGPAGRIPLLAQLFPQFASRLIRNSATLGGNLGTASPIGDSPPVLLALNASLVLAGPAGERAVPLAEYFTGYRTSVRRPDELIKSIRIPLPVAPLAAFHKISKRRFDDISSVAVAFAVRLDAGRVADVVIGLGGVAATPVRATRTEAALRDRAWTVDTVGAAAEVLSSEGTPIDDHRASAAYRSAMLGEALRKFHGETAAAVPAGVATDGR